MSIGWVLKGVLLISAIVIIIISLLQSGNNDNVVNSLSGKSALFANNKERGAEKVASVIMYISIFVFFTCVLLINVIL